MASALEGDLLARAAAGDAGAIESMLRIAQADIRRYAQRPAAAQATSTRRCRKR